MSNTEDQYVIATTRKNDLLGEIVTINPSLKSEFATLYPQLSTRLKDIFRVTQMFNQDECTILHGMDAYRVKTVFFLTRNHQYEPY